MEVIQLMAQGLANKQIALALGISEHTVKFHLSSLYAKLGISSRTEAVRRGIELGLISL
jgi:DNA-binding NarL/FixJ family response regulator